MAGSRQAQLYCISAPAGGRPATAQVPLDFSACACLPLPGHCDCSWRGGPRRPFSGCRLRKPDPASPTPFPRHVTQHLPGPPKFLADSEEREHGLGSLCQTPKRQRPVPILLLRAEAPPLWVSVPISHTRADSRTVKSNGTSKNMLVKSMN